MGEQRSRGSGADRRTSERAFRSLFHADRGPGVPAERDPEARLEIRAVSPGTDTETLEAVRRSVLHQKLWEQDEPPAGERDPSLSHVVDGGYITSRTVWPKTGEHAGSCTHILATDDPRTYGVVRPAQLWEAPCWQDSPPSTEDFPLSVGECADIPGAPEPGLDVDALREWVLGHDEAEEWLLALHSALEGVLGSGGKRIVFIGADPGEILRWVAAGTLLLPRKLALRVDFQVYAAHPQRSGHAVLAYRPEHTGQFARDDGEFVVFDLAVGRFSDVVPTDGALHWVPRFLRSDPYDVVNAVELAHQFARNAGREFPDTGDRWASSVRMLDERATEQRAVLAEWLARSPEISAAHARQAVIEAVLSAGPDVAALRKLVEGAGTDALAGQVRIALLWAELDAVMRGHGTVEGAPLPAREWLPEEAATTSELVAATAAKTVAERMDQLLRTATRFGVTPDVCRFGESAKHFVSWWLDRPDAGIDPAQWSCGDQMIELLRRGLSTRLGGEGAEQANADVQQHWWPLLAPALRDPFVSADALAASAAVQHGGQPRADAIAALGRHLENADRTEIVQAVWSALFGLSAPTPDEALDVLGRVTLVPKPVARAVFSLVRKATLTDRHLDLLRRMAELNQTPEPESLLRLWQEDGKLRFWITRFRRNPRPETGSDLEDVSLRVFSARAAEILDVLYEAGLSHAVAVAELGGDDLRSLLGRELPEVWNNPTRDSNSTEGLNFTGDSNSTGDTTRADVAVALAFATAWYGGQTEFRSHIDAELEKWANAHDQADQRRIRHLLRTVDTELVGGWHEWLRELQASQGKKRTKRKRR